MVIAVHLAIVVAENCVDAILLALINEAGCMTEIIIAVVILRSLRDKSCTSGILLIANPTARNIALHIVVVEGQFIRELGSQADTAFLSLAYPPIDI